MDKDWLKKNGRKVMNAYSIAVANKYDIKSTEDVIKILKLIDPANANENYAKEFSKMLQLFRKTCDEKYRKKLEILLQNAKGRALAYPAGFASLLIADDNYQEFLKNPSCPMPQDKQNKNQKSG